MFANGQPDVFLGVCLVGMGLGTLALGIKGFTDDGVPLSSETRIHGVAGKIVGVLCLLLAAGVLFLAVRVFQGVPLMRAMGLY
jgi:hypothetical protein